MVAIIIVNTVIRDLTLTLTLTLTLKPGLGLGVGLGLGLGLSRKDWKESSSKKTVMFSLLKDYKCQLPEK